MLKIDSIRLAEPDNAVEKIKKATGAAQYVFELILRDTESTMRVDDENIFECTKCGAVFEYRSGKKISFCPCCGNRAKVI